MWIGCADSRVPANEITGLDPGEVFVHRNVANVVVHSDLNALSTIQFAVEHLKVEHIIVVGHYGCAGVRAALRGTRVGLADNWLRHVQDVRLRHRKRLDHLPPAEQEDILCEMNVIEQVGNVALSTVLQDAWARGQQVAVHGWVYGLRDGLLKDLGVTMDRPETVVDVFGAALKRYPRVAARRRGHRHRLIAMFPHQLTDSRAFDIAQALLDGFNRHYRLFRETSAAAKERFERADWHGQQRAQAQRIEFYDQRVDEAVDRLRSEFDVDTLSMDTWQQVKLHYIGLLTDHHQPELAETFFNSVTAKLLHRSYFRNDFIFVRPAVSTEYIENDEPGAAPDLPRLLPEQGQPARDLVAHRRQLPARGASSRTCDARRRPRGAGHAVRARRLPAARQLPDPGAVEPVLPQQGRLPGRQDHQRLHRDAVRAAHPARRRRASSSSTRRCSARTTC